MLAGGFDGGLGYETVGCAPQAKLGQAGAAAAIAIGGHEDGGAEEALYLGKGLLCQRGHPARKDRHPNAYQICGAKLGGIALYREVGDGKLRAQRARGAQGHLGGDFKGGFARGEGEGYTSINFHAFSHLSNAYEEPEI